MKRYTKDNTELMEINKIFRQDKNLLVVETILTAMPARAVAKLAEVRKVFGVMSWGTLLGTMPQAISTLFSSVR